MTMLRHLVALVAMVAVLAVAGACHPGIVAFGNPSVECSTFEGPACDALLGIGLDTARAGRLEGPIVIGVGDTCPPNARCFPSALGGSTAAVLVRWSDGTIVWVTIPLPADWPTTAAGEPTLMADRPPAHLLPLVGASETVP